MRRLGICLALILFAACDAQEGERCNPLQYNESGSGNCAAGLTCVYPTAPSCGVAYCCTTDSNGNITDTSPNCQPDPTLAPICALDLSIVALDGGAGD